MVIMIIRIMRVDQGDQVYASDLGYKGLQWPCRTEGSEPTDMSHYNHIYHHTWYNDEHRPGHIVVSHGDLVGAEGGRRTRGVGREREEQNVKMVTKFQ